MIYSGRKSMKPPIQDERTIFEKTKLQAETLHITTVLLLAIILFQQLILRLSPAHYVGELIVLIVANAFFTIRYRGSKVDFG